MKKHKWLLPTIIISIICIAGVTLALVFSSQKPSAPVPEPTKFILSDSSASPGTVSTISASEFQTILKEEKSFVVIVHMEICPAEFPITSVAKQLAHDENLKFYSLKEDQFMQTSLSQSIRYLPSAAIYHDGKLVAFLDAESDTDLPAYKTPTGFKTWLEHWIDFAP